MYFVLKYVATWQKKNKFTTKDITSNAKNLLSTLKFYILFDKKYIS